MSGSSNHASWQNLADSKAGIAGDDGKAPKIDEGDDESSKINNTVLKDQVLTELRKVGDKGLSRRELEEKLNIALDAEQINVLKSTGHIHYEIFQGDSGTFKYDPKIKIKDEMSLLEAVKREHALKMSEIKKYWVAGEKKGAKEMVEKMWKAGDVIAVGLQNEDFVVYSRSNPFFAEVGGEIELEEKK